MMLLVSLYAEGNREGMPAGWPSACKEVDDKFPADQIPKGWQLMTLAELEQLKQPLKYEVQVALDVAAAKEEKARAQDEAMAAAEVLKANIEADQQKRIYVETEVGLTDGRRGRLVIDAAGLVHFEETK